MNDNRIPRARSVLLRRLRLRALPLAAFVLAVVATGWLWRERGAAVHGVGEVDSLRIDVTSPRAGVITQLPHRTGGQWTLFDQVHTGDVIARFDERQTQLDKESLDQEVEQALADVDSWRQRAVENADPTDVTLINRATDDERSRLVALLRLFVGGSDAGEPAREAPVTELPEVREGTAVAMHAEFAQLQRVRGNLELRWKQIRLQSEQLEIRAPISGTLVAVHCWPGQTVHQGAAVATIAADHGRHIVSYLPEESAFEPQPGMQVTLRPRVKGLAAANGQIEQVGRQVRKIPAHQLGGSPMAKWGRPVRITLPAGASLPPGTLVDVLFHRSRAL